MARYLSVLVHWFDFNPVLIFKKGLSSHKVAICFKSSIKWFDNNPALGTTPLYDM